jgi:hypothetical protein
MRHTLGQNQERVRTPFTDQQRNPNPPGPFNIQLTHPSGATLLLDASGNITILAASGKTVTIGDVAAQITLDGSGNWTIQAASGGTVTINADGGGSVQGVRLADGSVSTVLKAE